MGPEKRLVVSLVSLVTCSAMLGMGGCRWREGRSVWIEIYDSGPDAAGDFDADAGDADEGDGCVVGQGNWIRPEVLYGYIESDLEGIVIVDIRPLEYCQTGRIPGAQCNPLVNGSLTNPIDLPDEAGFLILYDANGDSVEDPFSFVPTFCHREVLILAGGFGAWANTGDFPIEQGE